MATKLFSKLKLAFKLIKELLFLIFLLIIFLLIMSIWGHIGNPLLWAGGIVIFSISKMYLLVSHTFKKLDFLIENHHSFNHMLGFLGVIVTMIVISFAIDYVCISEIYPNAFSGIQNNEPMIFRFSNLLYFSIVTFTTVGYGDITPLAPVTKIITVFEMMSSFIVIAFIISKYFNK